MLKSVLAACVAAACFLSPVSAQQPGEKILMSLPEGYERGYADGNEQRYIAEFVPEGQTVEDWQELLSVQVFYGKTDSTARNFADALITAAAEHCEGSSGTIVLNDTENGYDSVVFLVSCPQSETTNHPEWTLFKGIQGKDSFYLVHKAWAFKPGKESMTEWSGYLFGVGLCDDRDDATKCDR